MGSRLPYSFPNIFLVFTIAFFGAFLGGQSSAVAARLHYQVAVSRKPLRFVVTATAEGFDEPVTWEPGVKAASPYFSQKIPGRQGPVSTLHYSVDVEGLCSHFSTADTAQKAGDDNCILRDGAFLLRPDTLSDEAQVSLQAVGEELAIGTPWLPAGARQWTFTGEALAGGAYLLLGPQGSVPVTIKKNGKDDRDGSVQASVVEGSFKPSLEALGAWVSRSAQMVADFQGGEMPVPRTHLLLIPAMRSDESGVFGTTLRWAHGSIVLYFGGQARDEAFKDDWVAPHELFHLANPYVSGKVNWFTEGFTTYYTEILRARAHTKTAAETWESLRSNFDDTCGAWHLRSLVAASESMHVTFGYHRVYWGGACVAFIADVALREASHNRITLDDVYRKMRKKSQSEGSLTRDEIITELRDALPAKGWGRAWLDASLHSRHALAMKTLYRMLGISGHKGEPIPIEDAPWAPIRTSLLKLPAATGDAPPPEESWGTAPPMPAPAR